MKSETTTPIIVVKQYVRLRECSSQIEAQQISGLTVPQWCAENGIKAKSFYYHLRRVREQYIQSAQAIVSVSVLKQSSYIRIEKNNLQISESEIGKIYRLRTKKYSPRCCEVNISHCIISETIMTSAQI
ncbi:MAG: hypothetical protein MJ100_06020 [Ruminococcus sp.]|nr:hypothetical protein [Ruminococcus sp.]